MNEELIEKAKNKMLDLSECESYSCNCMKFDKNLYLAAAIALREKQERENPKPLTLEELKEHYRKSVYAVSLDGEEENQWGILRRSLCGSIGIWNKRSEMALFVESDYGKTWLAYDYEPKEEI